jgi:hypothetical protein
MWHLAHLRPKSCMRSARPHGMMRHAGLLGSRTGTAFALTLEQGHVRGFSPALSKPVDFDVSLHRNLSGRRHPSRQPRSWLPCKHHVYRVGRSPSTLAGQSGRFAFAECRAHVQTLQTSTCHAPSRAEARLWNQCTWISERIPHEYGHREILQRPERLRLHSAGRRRQGCFRPRQRA